MNHIKHLKNLHGLVERPELFIERKQTAKMRELQRRERKEKLYSYSPEKSSNDQG